MIKSDVMSHELESPDAPLTEDELIDNSTASPISPDPLPLRLSRFTCRFRHAILLFSFLFIILPGLITSYPSFLAKTHTDFEPPEGSPSFIADDIYDAAYTEGVKGASPLLLLISSPNEGDLTASDNEHYVGDAVRSYLKEVRNCVVSKGHIALPAYVNIMDYYSTSDEGLSSLAEKLMSPKGDETIVNISFNNFQDGIAYGEAADFIKDECVEGGAKEKLEGSGASLSLTGLRPFQQYSRSTAQEDLSKMDSFVLPLALLVLAFVVGNAFILIVAVWNILTSIGLTMIVMNWVADVVGVSEFTPSIMMSLMVAVGVDYSLFLLCRATEEVNNTLDKSSDTPKDYHREISSMIENAGHTIIASGCTLFGCFIGLTILPIDIVRTVGIGCSLTICSSIFASLLMTPALLHCGNGYLLRQKSWFWSWICMVEQGRAGRLGKRRGKRRSQSQDHEQVIFQAEKEWNEDTLLTEDPPANGNVDLTEPLLTQNNYHDNNGDETINEMQSSSSTSQKAPSFWYRVGRVLLHRHYGLLVLIPVLVAAIPIGARISTMRLSISFDLMLPADSPPMKTFKEVSATFGPGILSPFKIIFDSRSEGDGHVGTPNAFEVMHTVVEALSEEDKFSASPKTSFSGISYLGGNKVTWQDYDLMQVLCNKNTPESLCEDEAVKTLYVMDKSSTSPTKVLTYITVILDVDPFTHEGTDWLVSARETIASLNDAKKLMGFDVYIYGGSSVVYDSVEDTYSRLPVVIGATAIVVFVLMGLFFRSIVVPLRSVLSIAATLVLVFGMLVLVYQDGVLDWTRLKCFARCDEISWLPPVMAFSIIVGLGLDYDVFLISRILEYREEGYTDNDAVLEGLDKTGGVITAAGMIMAIAFGGLLSSRLILLNQAAFLLVIAVLLDTFVIRTLVVPVLMGFTRSYSWWPRKLPPIKPRGLAEDQQMVIA